MDEKLNIIGIKTAVGVFASIRTEDRYNGWKSLMGLIVDGVSPKTSFHDDWSVIAKEPTKIQRSVKQPHINFRYELIDPSMQSEKVPAVISREEAADYSDYEWIWKEQYAMYQSLYTLKSDEQPDKIEDVPFDFTLVATVDKISEAPDFTYPTTKRWDEPERTISDKNIVHQLLDKLIFPPILLPSRPCELSAEDSYKIIREHVKRNINPKVAQISSDYDFCFTVEKIIPLSENEKYTVDVNLAHNIFSKRKKPPKYEQRIVTSRKAKIFEMAPKPYHEYPIIKGFRGENHEDLQEKINAYLDDLMGFINQPVSDCPMCKGRGVVFPESIG